MAFYARARCFVHPSYQIHEGGRFLARPATVAGPFLLQTPRLGIPGLMRYIVIGNVLVYLLNLFSTNGYPVASALLSFDTSAILQGQVWRIITFIFVPTGSSNIFFFVLTLYFYYFIGSALEREWGSNKFTVFYFFGVILNIILGFFVGTASMYYVNMSMSSPLPPCIPICSSCCSSSSP